MKNHFTGSLSSDVKRYLREEFGILYWNTLTGDLTRTEKRHNTIFSGKEAGCGKHWSGYIYVTVLGHQIPAHQVVWFLNTDLWAELIDHEDRNRMNNNFQNLRLATTAQNAWNSRVSSRNNSGVKGVSWNEKVGKWKVRVTKSGVCHFGGYFDTLEDATKAAGKMREELHGEFSSECRSENGGGSRKRPKKPA